MLQAVVALVLLYLAVILLQPLVSILLVPLVAVARRFRAFAPVIFLASEALSMGTSILIVEWTIRLLGLESGIVEYGLVCLAFVWNAVGRLEAARSGATPVRAKLEAEGSTYEAGFQIRMETGMLLGDLLGFWGAFVMTHDVGAFRGLLPAMAGRLSSGSLC